MTKGNALIFGLGLGALSATVALIIGLAMPTLSPQLDNLSYRLRTYYRKLMPHPEFLPTPIPTAVAAAGLPSPTQTVPPTLPPSATPTATSLPAMATLLPSTATSTPLPTVTPTPAISLAAVSNQVELTGLTHQWQTWNNCGPATIAMNMSFFGRPETQVEAAKFLKPNRDDKNVNPEELAAYARTVGLEAIVRRGGSLEQLKRLVGNNLPVIAETWLIHDGDGLGHYRLIVGYDDSTGQLDTFDSLSGPNVKVNYQQFDADWRVFNRVYIVVYPPEQAAAAAAIIGSDMDETVMYERVAQAATAEVAANPNDAIALFNQGEALTRLGRFEEAVTAFDRARQIGLHWRRLWYQFTPFEAYYAVGRYQDVSALAEATIKGAGGLEEAYYYHGLALQALGQPGAQEDFQAALDYNPNYAPAAEALKLGN
ncbi:MAG: C39 family peptidase [Anaerolineae bacterium]